MASKGETELERRVRLLAQAREAFLKAKATEAKASRHHEPLADAKKKKNRDKKRKRAAADHASEPAPPPALASRQASRPRAHEASSSISSRRSGSSGGGSGVVVLQGVSEHPFEADLGDHCETPLKAYVDVAPLLRGLARDLGVAAKDLRIYDPYYCEGGMRAHLAALGFHTVINRNVDFYREPLATDAFDVLVTNPPYSANHVPRILSFCAELSASAHKPWLLLVPAYVHDKPYYSALISPAQGVGYVWPWLRYSYTSPAGIRGRAMAVAPFESVWHVQLHGTALRHWAASGCAVGGGDDDEVGGGGMGDKGGLPALACRLFPTLALLQASLRGAAKRDQVARTPRRPNPKARKRAAARVGDLRCLE